ncbi:MAG: ATP-binding cassette domain-containing protein [Faecalibacterium prausnitzii]
MIEVSHLTKKYGSRLAVDDLSFTVADGQIYGLLGPNGAGKSTIMNILTGYLARHRGRGDGGGHPSARGGRQQAKACVGYLPEQPPLYPEMTVAGVPGLCGRAERGQAVPQRQAAGAAAAHRTGLEEVLPRLIRSLSKGYRQRVGIAQALLGSPQLIILDEPTVGLDPAQVIEIRNLIRELGKAHTVILSSHILSEVQAVCQQVLILSKGRLVAVGSPEELGETLNPGSRLRATAQGEPDTVLAAVRSVPGICKVELESAADGQVTFTAESEDTADRRAAVSRALTEAGCTVLALAAENRSLEEVFLALTEKTPDRKPRQKRRRIEMLAIFKRELRSCFHGMIGAVLTAFMLAATAIYFVALNLGYGLPDFGYYTLYRTIFVLLLYIPVLTMRSFAEERHSRTDQLLLTSPVSVGGIVLGKYFALCVIFALPCLVDARHDPCAEGAGRYRHQHAGQFFRAAVLLPAWAAPPSPSGCSFPA